MIRSTSRTSVPYTIIAQDNINSGGAIRYKIKVTVGENTTQSQMRDICHAIIAQAEPHNAITFFFYWTGTDTTGPWSAANITWAPYGEWTKARETKTGDYSHHQLVVEDFHTLPTPASDITIPEETQRQIYYELVAEQDKGTDANQSYQILAGRYDVPMNTVRAIAIEGLRRLWPMPTPLP